MNLPFRWRSPWLAVAVIVIALLLVAGPVARGIVAGRLRAAAAGRGLDATWSALAVGPGMEARFRGLVLTRRAEGDNVFRAESLSVGVDPWSLLLMHPRPSRVTLAHATFRKTPRRASEVDTLAEEEAPARGERPGDRERAERLRGAARSFARLLTAPARDLPRLVLRDVTIVAGSGGDADEPGAAAPAGLRLRSLELEPYRGGVHLVAAGALIGEREVPFEGSLSYGHDDRLQGGVQFDIPAAGTARPQPLRIMVDGAMTQDRHAGRVSIADSTRIAIGSLRFQLGGAIESAGPRFRVDLSAEHLTASQWRASLPPAVLGPLTGLAVKGWYEQRLSLDLDLERPDSVMFTAQVTPHGLQIDAAASRLDLLNLDQPFVARIHLPHDRIVERDLSLANPHFLPLAAIDTLLVNAVVTNEDGGFYRHRGFNIEAVRGAIAANARAGSYRRGAGTITMQLVRNLYLGHARTLSRKAQEVVLAWVLEHLTGLGKQRMLEIYLNIVEWGPEVHGADEATRYYFGHDAGHVTPDEALFLATVLPAPTRWHYRFDANGALRPFEQAQMHFIGRAMAARGRLSLPLPDTDSLRVELRGPARDLLLPHTEAYVDTTQH